MQANLLIRTLNANAAFSTATGIVLIAAAAPIADWAGIPAWIPVVLGAGLLPFAAFVRRAARKLHRESVMWVLAADVAWVVGVAVLAMAAPSAISTASLWALIAITIAVAAFAGLELMGLRKIGATI